MKVVLAPDSYKGSLTQVEVANIMESAIHSVYPTAQIIKKPMADGGEGTLEALLNAVPNSKAVPINVTGPTGEKIETEIGIIHNDIAVIEIAAIAGLPLVEQRNPYKYTTYGIGEAILEALNRDLRKFIIGLGGSATNDGGFAMLQALGVNMYDKEGKSVTKFGSGLRHIYTIDVRKLDNRIEDSEFYIASDVTNPLFGPKGASYVFGPQKGATKEQIEQLDQALQNYSKKILPPNKHALVYTPGAGAAGGLGFAFLAIGATIKSGAKLVAETIGLEEEIMKADIVITGEGKSDYQTMSGKAPSYVANLARTYGIPVLLISGTIEDDQNKLNNIFTEIHEIKPKKMDLKRAINEAEMLLWNKTKEVLIKASF